MFTAPAREERSPRTARLELERLEDRINPGAFQIDLQFLGGLDLAQQAIFRQAAARWGQLIVGDLPNVYTARGVIDDVLIAVAGTIIDGPGGVLGMSAPDGFRGGTVLPYHGVMYFDAFDLANLYATGNLRSVILHEMGHILGLGTIWEYRHMLAGAGGPNPMFMGRWATAVYNAIFHRNAVGVPVENSGGPGTQDGHWRESILGRELMTGYLNYGGPNPLSMITLASLGDLGYKVNMYAADPFSPGGAGNRETAAGATEVGADLKGVRAADAEEISDLATNAGPLRGPAPVPAQQEAPPAAAAVDVAPSALLGQTGTPPRGRRLGALLFAELGD